ncbi:MAG TPA: glycosyltransferase [Pyrinomonadaceae bacterium]|jgi:glycosyltransferase involved in cell wall biosynthesis
MEATVSGVRPANKTRLLWLIDSLAMGGAERLVPVFARRLDASRFELHVACLKVIGGNPLAAELAAAGVPVTVLNARNLRDASAFARLLRLVREREIDVIHTHLTYSDVWGRLAARLLRRAVVSTLHVESYLTAGDVAHGRGHAVERLASFVRRHFGQTVIAVSEALRRQQIARGFPPARIVTMHNGIDLSKFELPHDSSRASRRAEFGIPHDAPLSITVAVLREGKGHELLIAASKRVLERVPEAHFLFVGGGALESALRRRAEESGVSGRVHFTGMRGDVAELLAASDLFVLPSLDFDALPTAIIEAMACGLAVIATKAGGAAEIVRHGETGLLLESPDASRLAEAVIALLSDRQLAREMGERGRARAESEFSAQAWVEKLQDLYVSLCRRAR